jgi:Rod binding domain-containing protein
MVFSPTCLTRNDQKLYQACQEYERYFYKKMLKTAHETRTFNSCAEDMFKTMFNEAAANRSLAPLGIAEQLYKQMSQKK